MKNDKFLIGIIAGIVVLAVAAVVLVLARGHESYLADDTPDGVAHNYFLAMQRQDYEKAYSYLSDELKNKPSLDEFISAVGYPYSQGEAALKIGEITITGDRAIVQVSITHYQGGGPFESNRYANTDTVQLKRNANGAWQLTAFPYPYWGYSWNETIK
jgi:hypothetical protein